MTLVLDETEARARYGDAAIRRAARHAMWREGDLSHLLHRGQEVLRTRWRSSSWRRFVANVARGWGKSFWCCVEAVECAIGGPRRQIRYAAPEAKMVETIVMPHMDVILADCPSDMKPEWREAKSRWDFPNGSKIFVAGANAGGADRLRGVSTDLAVIDEARDVDCLDYLIKSVLTPRLTASGRILIASTPPEMPDHALVGYIAEAQARNAYMHATIYDAPHVTPERIGEFLADYTGPDDPAWRREYLAEVIVDPTRAVLPELSANESTVVQPHERPEYFLPHIVGDLGYEDWTVLAFGYYDFASDIDVIEDELVLQRTRSDLIDAEASKKAESLWPKLKVHRRKVDAPPLVRADMARDHVRREADEQALEHWNATRTDDLRAAANAMRIRVARGRVRIHPRCATILAHGKYARWNRGRSGLERPTDADHHYDGCAALLYFGRELDRYTNPFPRLAPGITIADHHISDDLRRPEVKPTRQIFGRRWRPA